MLIDLSLDEMFFDYSFDDSHINAIEILRLSFAYTSEGYKVTPQAVQRYVNELADIPGHQLRQAIYQLIRTSSTFPTIEEIRNLVTEMQLKSDTNMLLSTHELLKEIKRCEFTEHSQPFAVNPVFTNELTATVAAWFGWDKCCNASIQELRHMVCQIACKLANSPIRN